jgi:hypothetical protein
MELDCDHVNGRGATVTRVVEEEIAAHGDLCAVGVLLPWAIVDTDLCVCDIAFAIVWNVFVTDENDGVGTIADSGHALSKTLEFLHVGFAPQFLVLGVYKEVPHFHEVARGFVKDSVEHVGGVLLLSCAMGSDGAACPFAIIVDAVQEGLLSYCTDLGLTAGVGCRTIHQIYLVIQYSQVGYSLGSTKFCEWGGRYMWHDLAHVIGAVGDLGAVPSCCFAVICHGLTLDTSGGSRDVWTQVGAQVGGMLGAVGEVLVVCTFGDGEPRGVGDTL